MRKLRKYLIIFLVVVLTVTQLPVMALASGMAYTAGNVLGLLSLPSGMPDGDVLMTSAGMEYNAGRKMMFASSGEGNGSGIQYALSLKIELNELRRSLSVQADINSMGIDAAGGELVVTLYDNKDGIPKLLDLFTAEIQSGVIEDTPDTPEALGLLSFNGAEPENLVISGVICRSLDEPLLMSPAVRYDANDFNIVPVSMNIITTPTRV